MPGKASVIEINGRLYSAETGELVREAQAPGRQTKAMKAAAANPTPAPRMIDGFSAPVGKAGAKRALPRQKVAAGDIHSKTTKTPTLHRAGAAKLQKPAHGLKPILTRRTGPMLEAARTARANRHGRSHAIAKFTPGSVETDLPAAPVLARPVPSKVAHKPVPTPTHHVIENERPEPKKARRLRPALASLAVALVLGGYVTYLNIPHMAMRVAASRAGFDASLPGYRPDGFKFAGPIAYSKGQITLKFSTNSDDREFHLTERQSNWDSQSLLANYVNREHKRYLTFQEKGLTVYVYDGSNATWVDSGVWYTIEGNSLLNSEQLLKMAASL